MISDLLASAWENSGWLVFGGAIGYVSSRIQLAVERAMEKAAKEAHATHEMVDHLVHPDSTED